MNTLDKIMFLLAKSGVQQKTFAEAIGVTKHTVTDWKNGKTKSYIKYIDKIAEFFEVSTDYLLTDDKKAAPQEQPLSEKQETVLKLSEQLTDEDLKKLIDYAELLRKAKNQ